MIFKNGSLAILISSGIVFLFMPGNLAWVMGFGAVFLALSIYVTSHTPVQRWGQWFFAVSFFLLMVISSSVMQLYLHQGNTSATSYGTTVLWSLFMGSVWAAILTAAFFALVIYFSSTYLLTLQTEDGLTWRDAFWPMLSLIFNTQYDWLKIENGQIIKGKEKIALAELGGPSKLTISPGNAVILQKGPQISRICGAGTVFTRKDEKIRAVFDLRSQHTVHTLKNVTTSDQISLTLKVGITYKIKSATPGASRDNASVISDNWHLFPIHQDTLRKAAFNSAAGGWKAFAESLVCNHLRDQIMAHTLDELFSIQGNPQDIGRVNRRQIKKIEDTVKINANQAACEHIGVEIDEVDIQMVTLPANVQDSIYMRIQAQAQAEAINRIETEKNKSRGQLMTSILDNISQRTGELGDAELQLATIFAQISRRALNDNALGHHYITMLKNLAKTDTNKISTITHRQAISTDPEKALLQRMTGTRLVEVDGPSF